MLRFDPVTYEWVRKDELTRATIQGDIEGYPVTIHISDEDIADCDEDGNIIGLSTIDIGVFQYYIQQMQAHGIVPAFRRKASADVSESITAVSNSTAKWQCPEHKDMAVYPNKFGPGLQCSRWVAVADCPVSPDWARDKMSTVNGQPRWYCKYRENYS